MTANQKRLLTIGCLVPLPILTALLFMAVYGGFDGTPEGSLEIFLFGLYWVLLVVGLAAWIWTLVIVRRSPLLTAPQRTGWTVFVILGTLFVLPAVWWRLVRPVPST